jgi:hypothetical protein
MIPVYGFMVGDTIGVLILTSSDERLDSLASKIEASASVRVRPGRALRILWKGQLMDPRSTVGDVGISALERVDAVPATWGDA